MSEQVKSLKKRKVGDSKSHSAAQPTASSKSDTFASTSVSTAVMKKAKKPSRLWEDAQPKLSEPVLQTIRDLGFVKMTPVQAATIPLFMTNKDVAVQACTGSGKTLSFLIPIIEILLARNEPLQKHEVGAIVISPTRELASQIAHVYSAFGAHLDGRLSCLLLVGGTDVQDDAEQYRMQGGNLVVATPGRLEDTMKRVREFNCKALEVLVLDEADRLLDMGFEKSINTILSKLPKQRRTGLFSATQTSQVNELIRAGLRNPAIISVKVEDKSGLASKQATPTTLANFFEIVQPEQKLFELVRYLNANRDQKVIVFVLTCAMVDYFGKILPELEELQGRNIYALHGQMVQKKRTGVYESFVQSENGVLVTTDLIARGVDIPDVDCILQYDPPQDPSFFVHRVGRTARMGKQGEAMVYLLPSEDTYIGMMISTARQHDFLKVKNVPAERRSTAEVKQDELDAFLKSVRQLALEDRDVMEKAQRAFVSFIRAYREHQCSYIFRLPQLEIGKMATGLGLLYMPIMSELKGRYIEFQAADIPPHQVAFKDPKREKQRLENMDVRIEKAQADREKRRQLQQDRARAFQERRLATKTKKTHEDYELEWKELQREANLLKKWESGKISREEYEIATGERAAPASAFALDEDSDDLHYEFDDEAGDSDDELDAKHPPSKKQKPATKSAPATLNRTTASSASSSILDRAPVTLLKSKKQLRKEKQKKKKQVIARELKQSVESGIKAATSQ